MRNIGVLLPSPAAHGYRAPVVLPQSEELELWGAADPEYQLTDQRATDGMYRLVVTGTPDNFTWVQTADALVGDYLIEMREVTPGNGFFVGADPSPTSTSSGGVDECLVPNAGFGATRMNFRKNGTFGPQNVAFNPALSVFLERVGTTCNIYNAAHWGIKGSPIGTQSAVDGGDRHLWAGTNVVGEWRIRYIPHPG